MNSEDLEPRNNVPTSDAAAPRRGLSVVLPAYNEEHAIAQTIARLREVLPPTRYDCETIVVDDGSSDRTSEIARQKGVKVIRHPANAGYGRSLKDGIEMASHDTVVITDADGTYPLERIPDLLREYERNFDMVVGRRTGREYQGSMLKIPLRLLLKWLVEFTTGQSIPDINSGLRVFSRATVMECFPHLCNTFSFTTSMTLAYLMKGKYVTYVPIDYFKRVGSSKVRLFRDSLRTLQYIVEAILYYNPIKLFLVLCGFTLSASGAALAFGLFSGSLPLLMFASGGVLTTILLFGFGMLAELLRRIMFK